MEFSFSDNQVVDSIDKVPEDFRGLYVESDGKFKLNSDDTSIKSAVGAITRMDVALKASRLETKAAKGGRVDMSPLSDFGTTPEEIAKNFTSKLTDAQKVAESTGSEDMQRQVVKIKEDLAKAHSGDLGQRDKRIEALTGQLHSILVKGEAISALAGANAIDPDLALPFLTQQVSVSEEDGKFLVSVKDAAGDTRYSGVTGSPMSIKELVGEMKANDKYAPLFKSEVPGGGGARPGGGQQRIAPKPGAEMTSNEKISAGLQKGQHVKGRG